MNQDFNFDLEFDSILNEFTENSSPLQDSSQGKAGEPSAAEKKYVPAQKASVPLQEETAVYRSVSSPVSKDEATVRFPETGSDVHHSETHRNVSSQNKKAEQTRMIRVSDEKQKKEDARSYRSPKKEAAPETAVSKKAEKEARRREKEDRKQREKQEKRTRTTFADLTPRWLVSVLGLLITLVLLAFVLCNVTPASGSAAATKSVSRTADISASVNRFATEKAREAAIAQNEAAEQALAEQLAAEAARHTVYKIDEEATVAPEPLISGFGKVSTANAEEILPIIQQARDSGLLGEDETVVFDPSVEFNTGSYYQDIQYYIDDTLLVVCWKEIIDGNTCTFCEVKMQDGSQLRRKLAGDMFGSDMQEYTTSMHKATNAVVSMNADYYRFRDMGIVVYNRQLYRFNESDYLTRYGQALKKYNCIDTMFVTASGDFLFFHLYEETTPEEMQQFIDENDIIFSVAFGPVLVENGELNTSYFEEEWYPIGEINTGYSRAGIGQVGELHYLYMSLNHSDEKAARWHTKEFAQHFYEKGVLNAYSLDGGQTSEIVFQGDEAYNHVDHVNGTSSRQVSDMIYFASAINGEEVTE